MAQKTKNISKNVVDKSTNRNVQLRYGTKRVRDPETGERTETTELEAVVTIKTAMGGRSEDEMCSFFVLDEIDKATWDAMTVGEAIEFCHATGEAKLGYS